MPEDERQRHVQALHSQLAAYAQTIIEQYTRPDLGTDLSFEALKPSIERIQAICRELLDTPIDALPPRLLQMALDALGHLQARFNELSGFNVVLIAQQNENPVQKREKFLSAFTGAESSFWQGIVPIAAFLFAEKLRRAPESVSQVLERTLAAASAALTEAQKSKDELAAIVDASRQVAADLGVTKHASLFAQEATEFAKSARAWLWVTAASVLITLVAVAGNLWYSLRYPPEQGQPVHVQLIVAKVLAFSLLISGTLWCGRMYRAAKHNWVINRHRQNALGTFQTFVQGTKDEATKDTVLLHAAQSIFQAQPPGYAGGDAEASSSSQLIEVVRTMSPQSKS